MAYFTDVLLLLSFCESPRRVGGAKRGSKEERARPAQAEAALRALGLTRNFGSVGLPSALS